jgi:hypothetical protein
MMVLAAALLLLPAWSALCSAAPGQQTPVMGYSNWNRALRCHFMLPLAAAALAQLLPNRSSCRRC